MKQQLVDHMCTVRALELKKKPDEQMREEIRKYIDSQPDIELIAKQFKLYCKLKHKLEITFDPIVMQGGVC
jgi:hypothetical protein